MRPWQASEPCRVCIKTVRLNHRLLYMFIVFPYGGGGGHLKVNFTQHSHLRVLAAIFLCGGWGHNRGWFCRNVFLMFAPSEVVGGGHVLQFQ